MTGNGSPPGFNEKCQKIDLDDRHFEYLMCVCDVNIFLNHKLIPESWSSSREELFQNCFNAMLVATDTGIILDEERDVWVMGWLENKYRFKC